MYIQYVCININQTNMYIFSSLNTDDIKYANKTINKCMYVCMYVYMFIWVFLNGCEITGVIQDARDGSWSQGDRLLTVC